MAIHEQDSTTFQCHICELVTTSKTRLLNHLTTHEESDSPSGIEDAPFAFMESEDGDGSCNYNLVGIQD
jgi:hypothetical protein